jgi:hypothetical protein
MANKGFYISKQRKGEIILNVYSSDFIQYLQGLKDVNGWIKFRIYEREKVATNGLTHNMELIEYNTKDTTNNG